MSNKLYVPGFPGPAGDIGVLPAFRSRGFSGGAESVPTTYSISGSIVDGAAAGIEGVTVTLSGDADDSATTDGDGAYSFTGLPDGSYTVTPTKDGYVFTDASENVSVSGDNVSVDNMVGVLTYITGLPFYIEGGWQDESVPSYGAQPANDWADSSSTALVQITNIVTPQVNGHTPSQSRTIQLENAATLGAEYIALDYFGWANAGIKFDPTNGIRVMMLACRRENAKDSRFEVVLQNSDATKKIRADYNNKDADAIYVREVFNASDTRTTVTCAEALSDTLEFWVAVGLEVPANYSGSIKTRTVTFDAGGANTADTAEKALANDWSSVDLNRLWVFINKNTESGSAGYPNICWIWLGTASDDWPI